MVVYVNGQPLDLTPGMRVRHALTAAGLLGEIDAGLKVYDEWGHEVGLDGELSDGVRLSVK
jgi:hypothetical protein